MLIEFKRDNGTLIYINPAQISSMESPCVWMVNTRVLAFSKEEFDRLAEAINGAVAILRESPTPQ